MINNKNGRKRISVNQFEKVMQQWDGQFMIFSVTGNIDFYAYVNELNFYKYQFGRNETNIMYVADDDTNEIRGVKFRICEIESIYRDKYLDENENIIITMSDGNQLHIYNM